MDSYLISIIVPVYNVELYISNCLDSLICQTYKNIEIIIVNDGSMDNSINICNKYSFNDNRIKIISQDNQGLSAARNNGLKHVKGNYFMFVDSDDMLESNCIEKLVDFAKNNVCDFVCCGTTYMSDDDNIRKQPKQSKLISNDKLIKMCFNEIDGITHSACGKLFKSELVNYIHFPVGKLYEDQFVMYKLMATFKAGVISGTTYIYRRRKESIITSRTNIDQKSKDLIDSIIELEDLIIKSIPSLKCALDEKKLRDYLVIIKINMINEYKNIYIEYSISKIKELKLFNLVVSKTPVTLLIQYFLIKCSYKLFYKVINFKRK